MDNGSIGELKRRFATMGEKGNADTLINGVVKSVDKSNYTCEVDVDGEDSIIASLICGDVKKGIVQIPKVNSSIVIACFNKVNGIVVMCDEIEEIIFNGGDLGGLVKLEELQKSLDSIKSYCEDLKSAISTGINAVGAGSAASGAAGKAAFETAMQDKIIIIENFENDKIKQ